MLIDIRKIMSDCIQLPAMYPNDLYKQHVCTYCADMSSRYLDLQDLTQYYAGLPVDQSFRYDIYTATTIFDNYLRIYYLISDCGYNLAYPIYNTEICINNYFENYRHANRRSYAHSTMLLINGITAWWRRYTDRFYTADIKDYDAWIKITTLDHAQGYDGLTYLLHNLSEVDELWMKEHISEYPVRQDFYNVIMNGKYPIEMIYDTRSDWIAEILSACRNIPGTDLLTLTDDSKELIAQAFHHINYSKMSHIDQYLTRALCVSIDRLYEDVTPISLDPTIEYCIYTNQLSYTTSDILDKYQIYNIDDCQAYDDGTSISLYAYIANIVMSNNLHIVHIQFSFSALNNLICDNIHLWDLVTLRDSITNNLIEPFVADMEEIGDRLFEIFEENLLESITVERDNDCLIFTERFLNGTVNIDYYSLTIHMLTGIHLITK